MDNPSEIKNETPVTIIEAISAGWKLVEQHGWFILIAVVGIYYLFKRHIQPKFSQWQQQQEDASYKKTDSGEAQSRLEAMERARQRMQEQLDQQAAEFKQKQKEKEEKARQEKIEDWERHQEGRGYRSKTRAKDDESSGPTPPKPKPKKPLRDSDYSPLMGASGSAGYRPARKGPASGG